MILPPSTLPFLSKIPMIEYAVTDLPEPDSPTMPKTFPFSKVKDTPLTDKTLPASILNDVLRFSTSNNLYCLAIPFTYF